MKWINKGHELDKLVNTIPNSFHEEVYIFGAGEIGKATGLCLAEFGLLGGFIDNDCKRQGSTFMDKPIISLEDYLSFVSEPAIVIAASKKNMSEIEQQLVKEKLFHGKNYYFNDEFNDKILPIIATYYFDKSYMKTNLMGSDTDGTLIRKMRDYYDDKKFIRDDGTLNLNACTIYQNEVLSENGFLTFNTYQKKEDTVIYPAGVFLSRDYTNFQTISSKTIGIHQGSGSWYTNTMKQNIYSVKLLVNNL